MKGNEGAVTWEDQLCLGSILWSVDLRTWLLHVCRCSQEVSIPTPL